MKEIHSEKTAVNEETKEKITVKEIKEKIFVKDNRHGSERDPKSEELVKQIHKKERYTQRVNGKESDTKRELGSESDL